ncbi:MAG: plasmid pRiA4b ORF-3 family protein [Sphaerochaetaceae bacterium]|nr:plasmid pRiA4b ORF-3 family protein [Sphaerochaetaceae bacterium]MDD4218799.1 plasmid pRiA4b ORF-3 family protein [Sphaerochaetaceae bacterium]MDY0371239.1 plasmid pRiA4b ORF-3 family protein [Sphaerochaetaceae bacterium]
MLIECSRALFRYIGSGSQDPTALYAPHFCWVGTSFIDENYDTCMVLTNKATGFCVITKFEFDPWHFDGDEVTAAIRDAFVLQKYDPNQIEAYLKEGADVRVVSGSDKSILSRLNRWLKKILDSELPLPELASTFSNSKVKINDKRIVPVEAMKEVLATNSKEILKEMHVVVNLKIVLRLTPQFKVFRSFEVPIFTSFEKLHRIIQIAFSWDDMHLHQFRIGPYKVGPVPEGTGSFPPFYEEEELDEEELTLGNLGEASKKFTYIYDFGDYWEHIIHVGKRELRDGEPEVICTRGEGDAPWEDSGGPYGYEYKATVLQDPEDEEYDRVCEWVGEDFSQEFDKDIINARLKGILLKPTRKKWF